MFGCSKLCQPQNLPSQWRSCRTGRPATKFHRRCSCQTFILVLIQVRWLQQKTQRVTKKHWRPTGCWLVGVLLKHKLWTASTLNSESMVKRYYFRKERIVVLSIIFFCCFGCSFESFQGFLTEGQTQMGINVPGGSIIWIRDTHSTSSRPQKKRWNVSRNACKSSSRSFNVRFLNHQPLYSSRSPPSCSPRRCLAGLMRPVKLWQEMTLRIQCQP